MENKEDKVICSCCGEIIYRFYFDINNEILCNKCVQHKYKKEVPKKEGK